MDIDQVITGYELEGTLSAIGRLDKGLDEAENEPDVIGPFALSVCMMDVQTQAQAGRS